jgi:ribosomal RNA-processing protein 1
MRAFWKTMAREWDDIGALRMDKYLFLVRQEVAASFKWLNRRDWPRPDVQKYMEILEDTPLNATEMRIPNGLRYHVLDLYLDELEKVKSEDWDAELLDQLMVPVGNMAKQGRDKYIRKAAREVLDDERLKRWKGEAVDEGDVHMAEDEDEEWGGIED